MTNRTTELPKNDDDQSVENEASDGERRRRIRLHPVLIALIAFILVDVLAGVAANRLSGQQAEVAEAKDIAAESSAAAGRSLVIIGSDPVEANIMTPRVEEALNEAAGAWSAHNVSFGASTVGIWAAGYDQHFSRSGRAADVLVIGFVNDQVEDQNRIDWTGIGNLHTEAGSLPDRLDDAPDINAKFEVAAAWASSLFGNRRWILSVLTSPIPSYGNIPRSEPGETVDEPSFAGLADFVADAGSGDTEVFVLALPTLRSYPVPDALWEAVEKSGGTMIDMREPELFDESDFARSTVLTADAADRFSDRLGGELLQLLVE